MTDKIESCSFCGKERKHCKRLVCGPAVSICDDCIDLAVDIVEWKPSVVPFKEFDLKAVGQEVQLVGGIWAGDDRAFLCYFPEYGQEFNPVALDMDDEAWKALLRQSDLVETEVLSKADDGTLYKAVVRKCQRTVEQGITWNVFRRDGYRCRYCGNDQVPLTVDHLVLWEDGGPSIEPNLVSACRKCNKVRGRTKYAAWLRHRHYLDVSRKLTPEVRAANEMLVTTLVDIPLVVTLRSR